MLSRNRHDCTTSSTLQEQEDSTEHTLTETSDGFSDPSSSSQRSTVQLQQPRVKLSMKGFPGNLTMSELQECVSHNIYAAKILALHHDDDDDDRLMHSLSLLFW